MHTIVQRYNLGEASLKFVVDIGQNIVNVLGKLTTDHRNVVRVYHRLLSHGVSLL